MKDDLLAGMARRLDHEADRRKRLRPMEDHLPKRKPRKPEDFRPWSGPRQPVRVYAAEERERWARENAGASAGPKGGRAGEGTA